MYWSTYVLIVIALLWLLSGLVAWLRIVLGSEEPIELVDFGMLPVCLLMGPIALVLS